MKKPKYIKISDDTLKGDNGVNYFAIYKFITGKFKRYRRIFCDEFQAKLIFYKYIKPTDNEYKKFCSTFKDVNGKNYTYYVENGFITEHLTEEEVFLEML